MSRLAATFARLRGAGERALVVYFTAGDPSLDATRRLVVEAERRGADVVELGVPFSDPLADGPVIRLAGERALAQGMRTGACLSCLAEIHARVDVPLVPMTYASILEAYGYERFQADAEDGSAYILHARSLTEREKRRYRRQRR